MINIVLSCCSYKYHGDLWTKATCGGLVEENGKGLRRQRSRVSSENLNVGSKNLVFLRTVPCTIYRTAIFHIFPMSCHLGPKGQNNKMVLIRLVHLQTDYKTSVCN